MKTFIIEDTDHLSLAIKFYGYKFITDLTGNLIYCSKFKLKNKKSEKYKKLGVGKFALNYKNIEITINIEEIGSPVGIESETKIHTKITITIPDNSESESILDEFLDEASKYYADTILDKKKEDNKTSIYIWDDYWETIEKRNGRKLDTVYLGGEEKNILNKIRDFLKEDIKTLYNDLGIPYKLNLLFHGFPGTGKSSLIYSIASELGMDIALLQFVKDMTDVDFMRALRRIPNNTILVLEDIDVLFEARKKNDEYKTGISFSGLLNSLDGIGHVDKQIVFMTTNCKMVLDKALIRPGRIDIDLEFKYSTKKQVKNMFDKFLPKQKDVFLDFYKKIKHLKLTTAILQQFFFGNIFSENILDHIDELIEICGKNDYDNKKEILYT